MKNHPDILKNFVAYLNGNQKAGRVEEFVPPKISEKNEEWMAGGMSAAIEVGVGLEKLEAEITLNELTAANFDLFGIANGQNKQIVLKSVFDQGTDTKKLEVVTMLGRFKEWDPGSRKKGDKTSTKYSIAISYYKYEIDGQSVIEIDPLNNIYKINGVDRNAEENRLLGI